MKWLVRRWLPRRDFHVVLLLSFGTLGGKSRSGSCLLRSSGVWGSDAADKLLGRRGESLGRIKTRHKTRPTQAFPGDKPLGIPSPSIIHGAARNEAVGKSAQKGPPVLFARPRGNDGPRRPL